METIKKKRPKCIKKERIVKVIEHWDSVPNGFMSTKAFKKWAETQFRTTVRGNTITSFYILQVLEEGVLPAAWGRNVLKVIMVNGLKYVKIKSEKKEIKKVGRKNLPNTPIRVAHSRSNSYIVEKQNDFDPNTDLEEE